MEVSDDSPTCSVCFDGEDVLYAHPRMQTQEGRVIQWLRSNLPDPLQPPFRYLVPAPSFPYQFWTNTVDAQGRPLLDHPTCRKCVYRWIKTSQKRECATCRQQVGLSEELILLGDGTVEWASKASDHPEKVAWRALVTRLEPSLANLSERIFQVVARTFSILAACVFCVLTITLYFKTLIFLGSCIGTEGVARLLSDIAEADGKMLLFFFIPPLLLVHGSFALEKRIYILTLEKLQKFFIATKNLSRRLHFTAIEINQKMPQRLLFIKRQGMSLYLTFQQEIRPILKHFHLYKTNISSTIKEQCIKIIELFNNKI